MHTRVGQILRSLFWTFLIHTANVSSFEHAVALKVPYYQPYVSMIWLLSYFELNCTAWPSNWQVLCLYSTKKCSFSKHFRPAVMSAHVSRGACMQHYEHPWCSHFDGQCSNEGETHPSSFDARVFDTEANKMDFDACVSNLPPIPACWANSPTCFQP